MLQRQINEQLSLRQMVPEQDAAFMYELVNEPGWLANIGQRNVHSVEDGARYIREGTIKSYEQHGFGSYLVYDHGTGESLGICGLYRRTYLEVPDLGFAFLARHQRKGYAFVASQAVMQLAQEQFGLTRLGAIVKPGNAPSLALLHKLGFRDVGMVTVNDAGDQDCYLEYPAAT